jgi:hypothetical protein
MIARDYEKPVDKDKDNVYKVTIIASKCILLSNTCYSNEINLKACFRLEVDNMSYFYYAALPPLKTWELQLRMYLNLYQKQSLLMGWIT